MTPTDVEKKRAQRWVAHYKLLTWISDRRHAIRRTYLVMCVVFIIGILSWFWSPFVGVLVMFVAVLPIILLMLAAGIALIVYQIVVLWNRAKGRQ